MDSDRGGHHDGRRTSEKGRIAAGAPRDLRAAPAGRQFQERLRVRDIMAKDVVTVSPDTSLQEAGVLLLKQRVGCLP
jgi:signal-transduction protein with cAMP-binding, CBS, and nucleotidyltransferase domain